MNRLSHFNSRSASRSGWIVLWTSLLMAFVLLPSKGHAQTFHKDLFAGTAGTDLSAHTPDLGAAYATSSAITNPIVLDGSGNIYATSAGSGCYLATTVPATSPANYTFSYDIVLRSSSDGDTAVWLTRCQSSLGSFSGAGIQQSGGAIFFQLRTNGGYVGSPVTIATPTFPATYHCTETVSGNDLSATISGPGLSGTQSVLATGSATSASYTAYGPLLSTGSSSTHYEIANVVGYQGSPTAPTTIFTFANATLAGGVNGDAFDTSTAAGSGYVRTMQVGADVDENVTLPTGGGVVSLNFDTSINTGGAGSGSIWTVEVDGAAPSPTALTTIDAANASSISTASLSAGGHRVRFVNVGNTSGSLRWQSYDAQMAKAICLTTPSGTTLAASSRPTAEILFLTDSIGEGYSDINGTTTNNYFAWPNRVARALNYSLTGYMISGIGMVHNGIGTPFGILNAGDTSGASDSWDHLFGGTLRPFATAPAAIVVCVGTNEWATDAATLGTNGSDAGSTDAAFSANLQTFFGRVRAKSVLANVPILVSVPFGGYKRAPILAAIVAYVAAHPSETHIKVLDLAYGAPTLGSTYGVDEVALFAGLTKNRPDGQDTIASTFAPDRTHPFGNAASGQTDAHGQLATVIAPRLTTLIAGGTAGASGSLTAGVVALSGTGGSLSATALRATGGSAPYTFQYQQSADSGATWASLGASITNQASTIGGITATATGVTGGTMVRLRVVDEANAAITAYSAAVMYGTPPVVPLTAADIPTIAAAVAAAVQAHIVIERGPITLSPVGSTDGTANPVFIGNTFNLALDLLDPSGQPLTIPPGATLISTTSRNGAAITAAGTVTLDSAAHGNIVARLLTADTAVAGKLLVTITLTNGSDVETFGPVILLVKAK